MTIRADTDGQRPTFGRGARLALGQTAGLIALRPVPLGVCREPGRSGDGQRAEGVAHRLDHAGETIEAADRCQHVRRVSPLPSSRTNEVAGAGDLDDGVEEQVLGPARDEARPELAEDGGVEASVDERQGEHVLPVDPTAHGIGRLPVGEAFGELKQGNES